MRAAASSTASGRCRGAGTARRSRPSARAATARRTASPPRRSASGGTAELDLALRRAGSSRLVTSDGEARARGDERGQLGRRVDDLLEVVERASSSSRSPMCSARPSRGADGSRDRLGHERRVAERGEADPEDAGAGSRGHERGADLDREARLPGAAGAGQRDEPRAAARSARAPPASSRSRPTKELAGRGRFVFAIVRSGGKSSSPELEERDRRRRCPSAGARRARRRGSVTSAAVARGEDDLPAVRRRRRRARRRGRPRRRSPRRSRAACPVCRPDAHPNRPCARAPSVTRGRGGERGRRASANARKNASPCVSTSTPPARARRADHAAVLGERLGVPLRPELVEEPRRALDVGEEERDRAGRQVGAHGKMMQSVSQSQASSASTERPAARPRRALTGTATPRLVRSSTPNTAATMRPLASSTGPASPS